MPRRGAFVTSEPAMRSFELPSTVFSIVEMSTHLEMVKTQFRGDHAPTRLLKVVGSCRALMLWRLVTADKEGI